MWAHIWPTFCIYRFLSFIQKLELFLRPYLKTRSHDGSAHTFGYSQRFLELPQKGSQKNIFWHFFIRSTKTQFKHLKYGMVVNWHK